MRARVEGVWQDIHSGKVYVDGVFRDLTEIRSFVNGAWEAVATFISDLTAIASPDAVVGFRTGPGFVTSTATTATPDGGKGPYTYSWARVGAGSASINSPSNATTTFSRTLAADETANELYRCTVTDAQGTTTTCDVTVAFVSINLI